MYKNEEVNDIDGVKIDFPDKWCICVKATQSRLSVCIPRQPRRLRRRNRRKVMDVVYSLV